MKKLTAMMLTAVMSISLLVGCGGGGNTDAPQDSTQAAGQETTQVDESALIREPMAPADSFAGGDGSKENPYQISNAAELYRMSYVMDPLNIKPEDKDYTVVFREKYYVLTNDIVINDTTDFANWATAAPEYGWEPIDGSFEGHLEGAGHKISGLYCYVPLSEEVTNAGLFGSVLNGGSVKNLTVENAMVISPSEGCNAGIIAGSVYESEISNCQVSGVVISSGLGQGGIVGSASWTFIKDCSFAGEVNSKDSGDSAGIVGSADGCSIVNCKNEGTITTSTEYADCAGGIAGRFSAASMGFSLDEETYPEEAAATEAYIQSVLKAGVGIKNCQNTGNITSGNPGGIVGTVGDGLGHPYRKTIVIENCENSGTLTGSSSSFDAIGGICAWYLTEPATLDENRVEGSLKIVNCTNTGDLNSVGTVAGGILGAARMEGGALTVDGCSNTGALKIKTDGIMTTGAIGGYVGSLYVFKSPEIRLENLTDENAYTVNKEQTVGGIVGSVTVAEGNVTEMSFTMKNCNGFGTFDVIEEPAIYGSLCGFFLEGIYEGDFQGTFDIVDCKATSGVPTVGSEGSFQEKWNTLCEIIEEMQEEEAAQQAEQQE